MTIVTPSRELAQNIHVLVNDHRVTHTDPVSGEVTHPEEIALLEQLRMEIQSGRRAGGGSGSGSRSPVALGAVTLYNEIRETLNTAFISLTGKDDHSVSPEDKLRAWQKGAEARNEEAVARCARTTTKWIEAINELINPEAKIELIGACPACGNTHHTEEVDGEPTRNSALYATLTKAECRSCGAVWAKQDMRSLALHLEGTS